MINARTLALNVFSLFQVHTRFLRLIKFNLEILSSLKKSIIMIKFSHVYDLLTPISSRHHDQISSSLITTTMSSPTGSNLSHNRVINKLNLFILINIATSDQISINLISHKYIILNTNGISHISSVILVTSSLHVSTHD